MILNVTCPIERVKELILKDFPNYYEYSEVTQESIIAEYVKECDADEAFKYMRNTHGMICKTTRCPKPKDVNMPWSESMTIEDEFDPYVFDGSMSVEDFKEAQRRYLESNN